MNRPGKIIRLLTLTVLSGLMFATLLTGLELRYSFTETADQVYCPLQKTWVARETEPTQVHANPLDGICMSKPQKDEFLVQIIRNRAFAIDENGIFETLKQGEQVLRLYRETPNTPQNSIAGISVSLTALNSKNDLRFNFEANTASVQGFSFDIPEASFKVTKYDRPSLRVLSKITRNINPRSPPSLI